MRRNNHGGIVSRTVVCALALSAALAGAPLTALATEDPAVTDDTTETTPIEEEPVESTPLAVTFYAEELEVEGVMADQIDYSGTGVALEPCSYRRAGYRFVGWRATTAVGEVVYEDGATVPASDFGEGGVLQLVALWEPISYTLTFDPAGGTLEVDALVCTYDEYVTYPVPQRPGYVFMGWALDSGVVLDSGNRSLLSTFDGDVVTLTALWEPTDVTIEFVPSYPAGSVGPSISSVSALYGEGTVSLPMLELAGYSFLGWADGTGTVLAPGSHLVSEAFGGATSNTATLTGVWAPHTYTLVCDYAGGTVVANGLRLAASAPLVVEYGASVELPSPKREGYVLGGWVDGNGATYAKNAPVSNLSVEDGASVRLTALWQKASADASSSGTTPGDSSSSGFVAPRSLEEVAQDQAASPSAGEGSAQGTDGAAAGTTGTRPAATDGQNATTGTEEGSSEPRQTEAGATGDASAPAATAPTSDATVPSTGTATTTRPDQPVEAGGEGGTDRVTDAAPVEGPTIVSATDASTSGPSEARVVEIADDATAMAADVEGSPATTASHTMQQRHGVLPLVVIVIASTTLLALSASLVVSARRKHAPGAHAAHAEREPEKE